MYELYIYAITFTISKSKNIEIYCKYPVSIIFLCTLYIQVCRCTM